MVVCIWEGKIRRNEKREVRMKRFMLVCLILTLLFLASVHNVCDYTVSAQPIEWSDDLNDVDDFRFNSVSAGLWEKWGCDSQAYCYFSVVDNTYLNFTAKDRATSKWARGTIARELREEDRFEIEARFKVVRIDNRFNFFISDSYKDWGDWHWYKPLLAFRFQTYVWIHYMKEFANVSDSNTPSKIVNTYITIDDYGNKTITIYASIDRIKHTIEVRITLYNGSEFVWRLDNAHSFAGKRLYVGFIHGFYDYSSAISTVLIDYVKAPFKKLPYKTADTRDNLFWDGRILKLASILYEGNGSVAYTYYCKHFFQIGFRVRVEGEDKAFVGLVLPAEKQAFITSGDWFIGARIQVSPTDSDKLRVELIKSDNLAGGIFMTTEITTSAHVLNVIIEYNQDDSKITIYFDDLLDDDFEAVFHFPETEGQYCRNPEIFHVVLGTTDYPHTYYFNNWEDGNTFIMLLGYGIDEDIFSELGYGVEQGQSQKPQGIFAPIINALSSVTKWIVSGVRWIADKIIMPVINSIFSTVTNIWNKINSFLDMAISDLYNKLTDIFNKINALYDKFVTFIDTSLSSLYNKLTDIYNKINDLYNKFVTFIDTALSDLYNKLTDIYNKIVDLYNKFVTFIDTPLSNLYNKLIDLYNKAVELLNYFTTEFTDFFVNAISFFNDLYNDYILPFINDFKNYVISIWDMIKSFIDFMLDVVDTISDFVKQLLDFIRPFVDLLKALLPFILGFSGFFFVLWLVEPLSTGELEEFYIRLMQVEDMIFKIFDVFIKVFRALVSVIHMLRDMIPFI